MSRPNLSVFSDTFLTRVIVENFHETSAVTLKSPTFYSTIPNQDRYIVEEWKMSDGPWTFAAVFDGHGGTEAADFISKEMPSTVKNYLASALAQKLSIQNDVLDGILERAFTTLDSRIIDGFMSLLPENHESLTPEDMIPVFKERALDVDGKPRVEIRRALSGTTATVALIDPSHGVHVASVGDSDAYLSTKDSDGNWQSLFLGSDYRFSKTDNTEVERVRALHPGEEMCVVVNSVGIARVLNYIILTSALGDIQYKLPSRYNQVLNTVDPVNVDEHIIKHTLTPPYLTNIPVVKHTRLPESSEKHCHYLILSSDGLLDLYKLVYKTTHSEGAKRCALSASLAQGEGRHMAAQVLWDALGGDADDNALEKAVAKTLKGKVDDVTVVVVPLPFEPRVST
ncbi:phosphatase 2C-like domain-containing protein [Lentinula raphanica]|nr:phosphatase 2C-like domain-containing protein [Lentinula raphanica]